MNNVLFNPALAARDSKEDPEVDFLQHLKADFPPAIVFFGSEDKKWINRWSHAYTKMKSLGIQSAEVQNAEGQGHGFFNYQPWANVTLVAADRFLKKHGLIKGEPTLVAPKIGEKLVNEQNKKR